MLKSPEISIVIPVYKRTTYFREALRSALAQTVPVEVLVVDDGTPGRPDGFQKIIAEEGNRAKYIYCETNLGQAGHWNRCLELAKTPWISMLHDDDILMPNGIELLLKAQHILPNKAFYYGLIDVIDEDGFIQEQISKNADQGVHEVSPLVFALHGQIAGTSGTIINRDIAMTVGGFDAQLRMTIDWDLWARLSLSSGAAKINAKTAEYRHYFDLGRGTTLLQRNGNLLLCHSVQHRRNIRRAKALYPDFNPPFDAVGYTTDAAFSMLRTMGCKLTPRGRRIAFAYTRRRFYRKAYQATCWQKLLAACFCWSRWTYSFVRPTWMKFKNKHGFLWGPN